MAIYKSDIVNIDLDSGSIFRSFLNNTIGTADKDANRFGVRVFRSGAEVDLSGCSCYGYFRDPQGNNIALTSVGTVSGNEAYITLPQACYNYEGQFCLAIKLIGGGVTGTVRIIDGVVDNTNTGSAVAPTSAVPTYTEILSQYDAMVAATAAANTAIAPTFAQGTAYAAGALVINDGALYALPNGHTAGTTWANTTKVATNLGDQVTSLKSAVSDIKNIVYIKHQVDFTNETAISYNISASNHKWAQNSSYSSYMLAIPEKTDYITIKADALNGSRYALLKTNGHTINTLPDYATGETDAVAINAGEEKEIYLPNDAHYLWVQSHNNKLPQSVLYNIQNNIPAVDLTLSVPGDAADALAVGEKVGNIMQYNMFNKNATDNVSGKSLKTSDGALETNDSYTTSGFIYIGEIEKITTSYVHIQCYYDEDKTFISGVANSSYSAKDYSRNIPQDCRYIRISFKTADINTVQIGESVDRNEYVAYGEKMTFSNLVIYDNQIVEGAGIIVAPSGGNYTSLTEAIYENRQKKVSITVKAGTYDIVSEYVALFGQEIVDALSDADTTLNGFQFGIRVNNKTLLFEPGSHVVCDWTGHTVNSTHRFSAFSVGRNSEIIGLDLDCTATFYAIHDDYGYTDRYYHNIYKDCRIIGHNITNQNLIGGGCKPFSKHTIENCYFDNGETSGACVRYHNTNISGAEPVLFVSNSYFGQGLTFRYYGSQTTKMMAYVNNCKAAYINKGAEGSASVDNVELYKWNNEEG